MCTYCGVRLKEIDGGKPLSEGENHCGVCCDAERSGCIVGAPRLLLPSLKNELAQWRAASTCTSYLYLKLPVNVVGKMSKTAVPPLCHHCVSILVFFFVHLTRKTTTNTLCSSFHINVSPFSKQPTCLKTELCVAACVSSTFTSPVRSVSRLVVRRVAWLS